MFAILEIVGAFIVWGVAMTCMIFIGEWLYAHALKPFGQWLDETPPEEQVLVEELYRLWERFKEEPLFSRRRARMFVLVFSSASVALLILHFGVEATGLTGALHFGTEPHLVLSLIFLLGFFAISYFAILLVFRLFPGVALFVLNTMVRTLRFVMQ